MRKEPVLVAIILMAFACSSSGAQKPGATQPNTTTASTDSASAQQPATDTPPENSADAAKRAAYPKDWEVPVAKNTKLDDLRRKLDKQISVLPAGDLEDQSPLPIWFRVYLRKQYPDLPVSGPYQYPRTANRILRRMLDNPNEVAPDIK